MKIRQGFVSNSSSTSFYIDASKHSKEKVEQIINKLLDIIIFANNCNFGTIGSICSISEDDNIGSIKHHIRMYHSYDSKSIIVDEDDEIGREKWPKKVIVVDSITDNSIPYSIQEFLEIELGARRQHWG